MDRTSITVSIDLTDPHEKALFEYVMGKGARKKSGYIKRLIHADMSGISKAELPVVNMDDVEDDDENDKKAMMDAF